MLLTNWETLRKIFLNLFTRIRMTCILSESLPPGSLSFVLLGPCENLMGFDIKQKVKEILISTYKKKSQNKRKPKSVKLLKTHIWVIMKAYIDYFKNTNSKYTFCTTEPKIEHQKFLVWKIWSLSALCTKSCSKSSNYSSFLTRQREVESEGKEKKTSALQWNSYFLPSLTSNSVVWFANWNLKVIWFFLL